MSFNCFVVDDQRHGIQAVVQMIEKTPDLVLAGTETNPVNALNQINLGQTQVDILFLDVDMPELSGIEFSKLIGDRATIIFVTAYTDFAFDAFQAGAVDYIKKPISMTDFLRAINKAKEKVILKRKSLGVEQTEKIMFIKVGSKNLIKLELKDLIYISVDDKYVDLHIGKSKPISIKKTLSELEHVLPADSFMRIHKSYLINLNHVESIVGKRIVLTGAPALEIGTTYLDAVYARFKYV